MYFNRTLFTAICVIICMFFFTFIPFNTYLRGVVVETHPLYWLSLAAAFLLTFMIRKKHYNLSLAIVFSIGLSLRLLVPAHTLYPDYDPWRELSSINYIKSYGFDLKGKYYHAEQPVLQILLLIFTPIFGEYGTIAFFGPIFGWALSYICLYKLSKCFLDSENILFVLSIYSTMLLPFQSYTVPEQIALPIGTVVIFLFYMCHLKKSRRIFLMLILAFTLLTLTHNLTVFSVLVVLFSFVLLGKSENRAYSKIIFLILATIFILYWQHYHEFLSSIFLKRTLPKIGELPEPWPKPLWWWIAYLTPKLFLALLLAFLILRTFLRKEMRFEVSITCTVGCLLIALGLIFPRGLYPWRMLNQFGGYFAIGILWLPNISAFLKEHMSTIIKILIIFNVIGLLADFPITNVNDYYVGGYWLGHSQAEVSAARYIGNYATRNSYVIIDCRLGCLIEAFSDPPGKLHRVSNWRAFEIYNMTSPEDAWLYCIKNGHNYIFVSRFYEVISHFDEISGAKRFSEDVLIKFGPPYFLIIYQNADVWIYKVNFELPK